MSVTAPATNQQKKPATNWRNRIVGSAYLPAKDILANPKNWRVHSDSQLTALAGTLTEVGWVQEVIVNKRTGFLLDGHARVALAERRNESVPVKYVDLSEAEESVMLAALDALTGMAATDAEALERLLGEITVENEALSLVFDQLLDEGMRTTLGTPKEIDVGAHRTGQGATVRPVLYLEQLATFEQALRSTGLANRGQALLEICRAYLEHPERQLDLTAEGAA